MLRLFSDAEEDREAMTSLQPAPRCLPYLGQERHGFCGGEDRPREVAVATADRWEEYRDDEEEDYE